DAWQAHPRGLAGHHVLPLVTADGGDDAGRLEGSMQSTAWLEKLPSLKTMLGALDTIVGRALLVRVEPSQSAERTVDAGAYWHRRCRVFMVISGGDGAEWRCGNSSATIPNGQAWLMDGWRGYDYTAAEDAGLIYLAVDTVGSGTFRSTMKSA